MPSGTNPLSLAALDSSPEGRALGRTGEFRPYSSTAERIQLLSCKLFALAKASPFRERWHGEAVTERVASGTNPLSLAALDSSFPFLSPTGDIFPRPGEVFRRASPWQRGQVSSLFVNGRKKPPLSCKLYALAKASPFRERWHGEAVTERVTCGTNPLSRLRRQLPREGEPLAEPAGFVPTSQRLEEVSH